MRSHLTAIGAGIAVVILGAIMLAIAAPRFGFSDHGDGHPTGVRLSIDDGESGTFQMKDSAREVKAKWRGNFSFAPDARSLDAIDGSLEIAAIEDGVRKTAVFEDGLAPASVTVDDKPAGENAEEIAGDLLQLFARLSGVKAEPRVKALLAKGGVSAVLAEVDQLMTGGATADYIAALAEQAALKASDLETLSAKIATLEGDYIKRQSIVAMLESQSLAPAGAGALLDAAGAIESDHELRLVVEAVAKNGVASRNYDALLDLFGKIEGDHEIRLAAQALLSADEISEAQAAKILRHAARKIGGDHELRLVIEEAGSLLSDGGEAASAAIEAIEAIEGGSERRLAIEAVAEDLPADPVLWLSLIDSIKGVDGDHERRLALKAAAAEMPAGPEVRKAWREAAQTIESERDRELALEILE